MKKMGDMKARDIHVTVSGTDDGGEQISMSTKGSLRDLPEGHWLLEYDEINPADLSTASTSVLVQGERATVSRTGAMMSTLVFDEGETFVGDYMTPVGSFQVRMLTSQLSIKRRGGMGHINIHYQISLSTAFSPLEETAARRLELRFRPCR